MSEKIIADALGLRSLEEVRKEETTEVEIYEPETVELVPQSEAQDELIDDIEFAKGNIKDLIQHGGESLSELIAIAKQSESPRAFEVVSGMIKTLMDANKDLVSMSEKKKFAKEDHPQAAQTNVTNNNLILSTADLLKMMKGENT